MEDVQRREDERLFDALLTKAVIKSGDIWEKDVLSRAIEEPPDELIPLEESHLKFLGW